MDTALALAGAVRSTGARVRRRARRAGRRRLVDRRRGLRVRGGARLGDVVPPRRWQRRDLVRLDGVQGCLSQPLRRAVTRMGGRPAAVLPSRPRAGAARRPGRLEALRCVDRPRRRRSASSTRDRSSGSSARTARARRRCFASAAGLIARRCRLDRRRRSSRPARARRGPSSALVPDEPTGFDELTGAELVALVHALWRADERAARARARCSRTPSGSSGASISGSGRSHAAFGGR